MNLTRAFISRKRHDDLTAAPLAELWQIFPKRTKSTMTATTKNGVRSEIMPLSCCYRSDRIYNLKILQGRFATNTLFADMKLLHENTCCLVYKNNLILQNAIPSSMRNCTV